MKNLKSALIIGTIFVLITGTLSHFVYDWSGQNFIVGFFSPVNESTWDHMKLSFFPMLLFSVYLAAMLKGKYPCIISASACGILLATFLIPVLFYTYSGILGKTLMPLDIATFILSVLAAFFAIYRLTLSCKASSFSFALWTAVVITGICFLLFTYLPPQIGLFQDPATAP